MSRVWLCTVQEERVFILASRTINGRPVAGSLSCPQRSASWLRSNASLTLAPCLLRRYCSRAPVVLRILRTIHDCGYEGDEHGDACRCRRCPPQLTARELRTRKAFVGLDVAATRAFASPAPLDGDPCP